MSQAHLQEECRDHTALLDVGASRTGLKNRGLLTAHGQQKRPLKLKKAPCKLSRHELLSN